MAYVDNALRKPNPPAIVAVIGIHALVGYALVTGLSFTKVLETVKNPQGIFIPEVPLEPTPPPPPPEPTAEPQPAVAPNVFTPPVALPIPRPQPDISTTGVLPPITDIVIPRAVPSPVPSIQPSATPTRAPLAEAVAARPRNSPGGWVTTSDYMSRWIREEWTGTVGFRLGIGADGRVDSCSIMRSSGYPELDEATCRFVTRRARFDAAKDGFGARTAGSYTGAVRWELPE